jgi:hypothetical protein
MMLIGLPTVSEGLAAVKRSKCCWMLMLQAYLHGGLWAAAGSTQQQIHVRGYQGGLGAKPASVQVVLP